MFIVPCCRRYEEPGSLGMLVSIPHCVVNILSCLQTLWLPVNMLRLHHRVWILMMMVSLKGEIMHLMSNEDPHLEEGSGDSEEDTLSNFVEDVNNMVTSVNFANNISNPSSSSGKRKGVQQCTQKSGKKRFGNGSATVFAFRSISW